MGGPERGTVISFDDAKGWGAVRSDGGVERFFHCTAIADGSRHIRPDVPVEYDVVAGPLGRWEASAIRPAR